MAEHRRLLDMSFVGAPVGRLNNHAAPSPIDRSVKDVALVDRREIECAPTAAPPPLSTSCGSFVRLTSPGIYDDIPAAVYHADPCPEPSLSSSIAKLLCLSSPAHARYRHPRLNPSAVEEEAEHFDIGTVAHAVLLEGEAAVAVIDAPDWRTNAAKHARDVAMAAGKTPLLAKRWADVQAMVTAARAQLDAHTDSGAAMFTGGKPEQTLIWQEDGGIWCRARLDWLRPGHIDDFKSSTSANPENWTRTMFSLGFDLQSAFYRRGVKVLTGEDAIFRFAVIETTPPYALSVIALGPDAECIAEKKRLYAVEQWTKGIKKGKWPGYPSRTCWAELPPWEETKWLSREEGLSFNEAR